MTDFKKVLKKNIRVGDQVSWISSFNKFGFVKRKFKSQASMPKTSNNDVLPFSITKGQEIYELYNPHENSGKTFVAVSKIKLARRK